MHKKLHYIIEANGGIDEVRNPILQGSTNNEFIISILQAGSLIKLPSVTDITATIIYNNQFGYYTTKNITKIDDDPKFTRLSIPFDGNFVAFEGNCKLSLKIQFNEDGKDVILYTNYLQYEVQKNEAYIPKAKTDITETHYEEIMNRLNLLEDKLRRI